MINKYTLSFLLLVFISIHSSAQNEMLIEQLSGRTVTRENFNSGGTLISKQHFQISEIQQSQGIYQIEINIELFNERGELDNKYTTLFQCNYDEVSIMILIMPFLNPKSEKTIVNSKSDNFIQLYNLDNLEDIEFEISFDAGFLKLFGSKSVISLHDRTYLSKSERHELQSKLSIKAYAFGLRIKKLDYEVVELLGNNNFLSSQIFTNPDGSYFSMNYRD